METKRIRKVTSVWTTREGKKIRICDMTDDHLLNTITFVMERVANLKRDIPFPMFNGEMAQICAEADYDRIMDADPEDIVPSLADLRMEKERRGLKARSPYA